MSIHVNGEISKNFPLYHTSLIPICRRLEEKIYSQGKRTKELNFYTNEHPDFFRLDSMRLNGYRNPFLDEVIKVDRNEQFNKMNSNAEQIELINYIKSNRKFSQDPKVLRVIMNEFDIEMQKKIQQISDYTPRINYKMKITIDPDENSKKIGKYFTSEDNYDKLKQITCQYNPHKSAYISNSNDYKISEANGRDKQKEFTHKRKALTQFNLINYKNEKIKPPLSINEKWSKFYENFYMTLLNNKKGFSQKGGLFTEFTNKNIGVINVNRRNNKEKLLKEKKYFHVRNALFGEKRDILNKNIKNKEYDKLKIRNNSIKYDFVSLNKQKTIY